MKRIMKNSAVQSLLASLACIIVGLLIGYIVLLFINPAGAWDAILTVIKNFFYYPSKPAALSISAANAGENRAADAVRSVRSVRV